MFYKWLIFVIIIVMEIISRFYILFTLWMTFQSIFQYLNLSCYAFLHTAIGKHVSWNIFFNFYISWMREMKEKKTKKKKKNKRTGNAVEFCLWPNNLHLKSPKHSSTDRLKDRTWCIFSSTIENWKERKKYIITLTLKCIWSEAYD